MFVDQMMALFSSQLGYDGIEFSSTDALTSKKNSHYCDEDAMVICSRTFLNITIFSLSVVLVLMEIVVRASEKEPSLTFLKTLSTS